MIGRIKRAEMKTPQIAVVTVALPLKADVRHQEWAGERPATNV